MRIAHVITRMIIGGAQENTLFCCQDLIRQYHDEVLLITGPSTGPEGDLLRQAEPVGVPLAVLPHLRRAINPWHDLRCYYELKDALRQFAPQVVHTHSAKGGFLGRVVATALEVPAIVHTVHGAPFHPFQSRPARMFFRWCEAYAADRCDALISVADAMTDLLVDSDVAPRDKFTTIYSGMDVEPFLHAEQHRLATRRELGFLPEHVVVGKIARLFHLKGHTYLIDAAREVIRSHPQVRFLLVGDGVLRDRLTAKIRAAGLQEYFHFAGLVAPQRIPAMISAMDILVHVSLREGLARALPQALIAGKPTVSFDVDGAREVVISGETGLLVPACQVQPLAEALGQLVGDSELRRRLGQQGRDRLTDRFRHETMTRQIRLLYDRLLSRSEGPSRVTS